MKYKEAFKILSILASGIFIFSGCKKDPLNNLSNDETRIYVTNFDSTVNFANYKTFSVSDSASIIQDNQSAGKILGNYEIGLIDQLQQSMQARGYTLVSKSASPDLAINISEIINTQTALFSYDNYWNDYGSYYDPYYWGYPDYGYYSPDFYGSYSISTDGLEIDLLDLKNATANGNKITVIWTGLVRGEDVFNPANAASEITMLFGQSSYLKN
ncbi:MAG: DUF4136 domain-containing protein [Bacteroidetes bacterium]|nr:DUF4136 domain-containing protein [Bacteroidota bacterium]